MVLRPGGGLTWPKMLTEWEGSQHQATYGSGAGSLPTKGAAAAEVPPASQK